MRVNFRSFFGAVFMFCPSCGKQMGEASQCSQCGWLEGNPVPQKNSFNIPPVIGQPGQFQPISHEYKPDLGMRMLIPIGRSPWAIAAGYMGLISLLMFPAPIAIVFGVLAIRDINKNPKLTGLGRAWFGLIMGILGSIGLLFMLTGLMFSRR
jgi:hypothetical protein